MQTQIGNSPCQDVPVFEQSVQVGGWNVEVTTEVDRALLHARFYVVPDALFQVSIDLLRCENP